MLPGSSLKHFTVYKTTDAVLVCLICMLYCMCRPFLIDSLGWLNVKMFLKK